MTARRRPLELPSFTEQFGLFVSFGSLFFQILPLEWLTLAPDAKREATNSPSRERCCPVAKHRARRGRDRAPGFRTTCRRLESASTRHRARSRADTPIETRRCRAAMLR